MSAEEANGRKTSVYDLVLGPFDPSDLNTSYLSAVNQVLGTDMSSSELARTQNRLIRDIDENNFASLSLERQELWTTLSGIKNILAGDFSHNFVGDTLSNWPIFQGMMDERENNASRTNGIALMLGSASVLSSVAFGHLAKEVYGTERTIIVDLKAGDAKAGTGNFIQADAFRLPFDGDGLTGTIGLVHTDHLLSGLVDRARSYDEFPQSVFALVKEIARILPIGGQLFMNETLPGVKANLSSEKTAYVFQILTDVLGSALNRNGMRWSMDQAALPSTADFWHDPSRSLEQVVVKPINSLAVYAQKIINLPDTQFAWAEDQQ